MKNNKSKKQLKRLITLVLTIILCLQSSVGSLGFAKAAEMPYGKSYMIQQILSDYQYFIESTADITAPHNVGAIAVGGDTTIGNFGDGAIEDSYIGNIIKAGNYNGGADGSYLKDNEKYAGHIGKTVYYGTAISIPSYATKWTEDVPYIDFSDAFTSIKEESINLASKGKLISSSDITIKKIDGNDFNTIVIPFGPEKEDLKNVTIPYNLYKSADVILISGLYESGLDSFHKSEYVINLMGNDPIDLATSIWNKQVGGKAIAFESAPGNYVWLQNEYSLKKMSGIIQTGQMNMNGTKLIWNMPETTTVSTHTMAGHVVAPNATTTVYSGNFEGGVIAKNVINDGAEGHFFPYSDVKEKPATAIKVENIKLIKTFEDDKVKGLKSGAFFVLYSDEGCQTPIISKVEAIRTIDSDDFCVTIDGQLISTNTTYYLKEVTAPSDYVKSDIIYECNVDADGNVTYRIYGSGEAFSDDVLSCKNMLETIITPTVSPEPTASIEPTTSPEPTTSIEPTTSPEPTTSIEPTISPEPTVSIEPTVSTTPTKSPEPTVSIEPTVSTTPTKSPEPTVSIEPTVSTTPTKSPEPTVSIEPTVSTTPTKSPKPTASIEPTVSTTPTKSPKPTVSIVPTVSTTPTKSPKPTTSIVPTVSTTPTKSPKPTASIVPTVSTTPTKSPEPTVSIVPTVSSTPEVTKVPATPTKTPTGKGILIDDKTGEVIQKIPTTVTIEENSTVTVSFESKDSILIKQPDGTNCTLDDVTKLGFTPSENSKVQISKDGTIIITDLEKGTKDKITVTYDLGNGDKIIIGVIDIEISLDGDVSVVSQLIDPYGIVTDAKTGDIISGAEVILYYADTDRNISSGKIPNTVVKLPKIDGFEPNNNINPQLSDGSGSYAYMVYPYTDYYLVVTKDGYHKYISPTISVEEEIVKHDIKMIKKEGTNSNFSNQDRLPQAGSHVDFMILFSFGLILIILGFGYKLSKKIG